MNKSKIQTFPSGEASAVEKVVGDDFDLEQDKPEDKPEPDVEIKTVKMVCEKSIHPDGAANVHPDEVENWKAYGWVVVKQK